MNISVVGAGYVGLVTAACFSELGHRVKLIEIDTAKVELLERGIMPVHEEGLAEMWNRHRTAGFLDLTSDYVSGLANSEIVFICVGTPSSNNGEPDLKWVRSAAERIGQAADGDLIVVNKSTVPVGTAALVGELVNRSSRNGHLLPVVSNPEFLREGCAVYDFLHPTRVVVGSDDRDAARVIARLYEPLGCPIISCDAGTAEMSKYASNAFLAARISFINEIALLCDRMRVNVVDVARVVGLEPRCGEGYLGAGLGWGGSCLPKDVRALIHMAEARGLTAPLLRSVQGINLGQPRIAANKLRSHLGTLEGRTVAILGLAFKPNSDDLREAVSLALIDLLERQGCKIRAYDPVAMSMAARLLPKVTFCLNAYDAAEGSDAVILVTEWAEFRELDLVRIRSSMRHPILIDGRNFYVPGEITAAGLVYEGMGQCSRQSVLAKAASRQQTCGLSSEKAVCISGPVRPEQANRDGSSGWTAAHS